MASRGCKTFVKVSLKENSKKNVIIGTNCSVRSLYVLELWCDKINKLDDLLLEK